MVCLGGCGHKEGRGTTSQGPLGAPTPEGTKGFCPRLWMLLTGGGSRAQASQGGL